MHEWPNAYKVPIVVAPVVAPVVGVRVVVVLLVVAVAMVSIGVVVVVAMAAPVMTAMIRLMVVAVIALARVEAVVVAVVVAVVRVVVPAAVAAIVMRLLVPAMWLIAVMSGRGVVPAAVVLRELRVAVAVLAVPAMIGRARRGHRGRTRASASRGVRGLLRHLIFEQPAKALNQRGSSSASCFRPSFVRLSSGNEALIFRAMPITLGMRGIHSYSDGCIVTLSL